ncbi:MAG: hypothetical protein ACRD1T_01445 [Acidimicrobiia bacterium]
MKPREKATDCNGIPLASGLRVRLLGEVGHPEARIVRVVGDHDVVTVILENRTGRMERMYPCNEIGVIIPAQTDQQVRRAIA